MKPYEPYSEEAFLIETAPETYAIRYRGVQYQDSGNVTALGVLLFGLRPAGFNFKCKTDPAVAMHMMQHAAYILHLHANGDRRTQAGERRISDEALRAWLDDAIDLAPDADSAAFVQQCLQAALGPFALLTDEELLLKKERQ